MSPKYYEQLFINMMKVNEKRIPAVKTLLPDHEKESYRLQNEMIKYAVKKRGLDPKCLTLKKRSKRRHRRCSLEWNFEVAGSTMVWLFGGKWNGNLVSVSFIQINKCFIYTATIKTIFVFVSYFGTLLIFGWVIIYFGL